MSHPQVLFFFQKPEELFLAWRVVFFYFASEFYIQRYELLTKGNELISGIGFSDDYGSIPILYALVFVSLVGALFSFSGIVRPGMKKILLSVVALALVYFVGNIYPKVLQK